MKRIHKVCYMLKKWDAAMRDDDKPYPRPNCFECKREQIKGHGRCTKMCLGRAEEFMNIVKFGNPWGKRFERTRASWPDRSKYTGTGRVK